MRPPFCFHCSSVRPAGAVLVLASVGLLVAALLVQPADRARASDALASSTPPTTSPPAQPFVPRTGSEPPAGEPFVVAAVGDGADGHSAADAVVSQIAGWKPNLLLYLGDVYNNGSTRDFAVHYGPADDPTRFAQWRDITNPTPGNHEYATSTVARPYLTYWGDPPRAYSVDTHGWHIISLDSNCGRRTVDCDELSAQYLWLQQDLASTAAPCVMAFFHHPRWTTGEYLPDERLQPFWRLLAGAGTDLVLAGHDHNYQRWLPLDADGVVTRRGTSQFVVGSGGHGLYDFKSDDERLATRYLGHGALRLELTPTSYRFRFSDSTGVVRDAGGSVCSGVPDLEPPPPVEGISVHVPDDTSSAVLSWSPVVDPGSDGWAEYEIVRDGVAVGRSSTPSYVDRSVVAGAHHTYEVRAVDDAGNAGPLSAAVSILIAPGAVVQTTAPTLRCASSGRCKLLVAEGFESSPSPLRLVGLKKARTGTAAGPTVMVSAGRRAPAAAFWTSARTERDVIVRFRFRAGGRPGSPLVLSLLRRTAAANPSAVVGLTADGRLQISSPILRSLVVTPRRPPPGRWHVVTLRVGAGRKLAAWLNGKKLAASKRVFPTSLRVGRVQIGDNGSRRAVALAIDDVEIASFRH